MKKFFALVFLLFIVNNSYSSTTSSLFAEQQYALKNRLEKVHIVVKKEYIADYSELAFCADIHVVVYGYGDMKIKGCKKYGITYICLLDKDCKPVRSFIIPKK